ncbi:hypothetical protein LWI29_030581 [Acer saccharum]|uniref:Uncharacterized protein n=1 Tax=Acer saccharum TaxID=4024 RepID=A0AA39S4Y8_ACESA|nr:hypothetical protein LWI29_030581 [Acer saccharum]
MDKLRIEFEVERSKKMDETESWINMNQELSVSKEVLLARDVSKKENEELQGRVEDNLDKVAPIKDVSLFKCSKLELETRKGMKCRVERERLCSALSGDGIQVGSKSNGVLVRKDNDKGESLGSSDNKDSFDNTKNNNLKLRKASTSRDVGTKVRYEREFDKREEKDECGSVGKRVLVLSRSNDGVVGSCVGKGNSLGSSVNKDSFMVACLEVLRVFWPIDRVSGYLVLKMDHLGVWPFLIIKQFRLTLKKAKI